MSTYEGEHMIFGLLGQANLTQNDGEQGFLMGDFGWLPLAAVSPPQQLSAPSG
jgi:hypothetical protein